jgi:hypothetical protein
MENPTQLNILLKAIDIELLAILTADLEAFKTAQQNIAA